MYEEAKFSDSIALINTNYIDKDKSSSELRGHNGGALNS